MQKPLQGAGLVPKRSRRGRIAANGHRRPIAGMLMHIDGSKHCCFQNSQLYDLIVSWTMPRARYYAQLVEEESTRTVMAGLRELIESKGLFCRALQRSRQSLLVTSNAGEPVDKHRLTQVGRALKELHGQMIPADSPQARGVRNGISEWQRRLPQELRLAVFTAQTERIAGKDNTFAICERVWQIDKSRFRSTLAGCTVTIHEHLDGSVSLRYRPHAAGRFDSHGRPLH